CASNPCRSAGIGARNGPPRRGDSCRRRRHTPCSAPRLGMSAKTESPALAQALATALAGATDGVLLADPAGRISVGNRALAAAWNRPQEAVVGRLLHEFVVGPGADPELRRMLAALREQGSWRGELRTRDRHPSEGAWDVVANAVGPGAHGMIAIFRDV